MRDIACILMVIGFAALFMSSGFLPKAGVDDLLCEVERNQEDKHYH